MPDPPLLLLTPQVPTRLESLSLLNTLRLDDNSLSGTLPAELCGVPAASQAAQCQLQGNQFACPLPPCGDTCHATCS